MTKSAGVSLGEVSRSNKDTKRIKVLESQLRDCKKAVGR